MFKKGDYIVITFKQLDNHSQVPSQYCYKQEIDGAFLIPKDQQSYIKPVEVIDFKNRDRWRYAKPHEIEIYELAGRPIDTRKLFGPGDKVVTIEDVFNTENTIQIPKNTMLIVEDTLRTTRAKGGKGFIYFPGITGIFDKKGFKKYVQEE